MSVQEPPLVLCAGGYELLADEAGNRAQIASVARERLARDADVARGPQYEKMLDEVIDWVLRLPARVVRCRGTCAGCATSRAHYARGTLLDVEV